MKKTALLIGLISLFFIPNIFAQLTGTWTESNFNITLVLNADGSFQYSGNDGQSQGRYGVQNNVFAMQYMNGNLVQYTVQGYSENQMVLIHPNGTTFNLVRQQANTTTNRSYPWQDNRFQKTLVSKGGQSWTESQTQIYVGFIQLLVGQQLSASEINQVRQSNIADFNENPQTILTDVSQVETAMKQIYAQNSPVAVAMVREELFATLHEAAQKAPEMNQTPFMQIYNRHVQVLKYDPNSRMSISNQDVAAYIQYLQFQSMVMGQSAQASNSEREMLQMQLINGFDSYSAEQKQAIAYASFIWNTVSRQWSQLSQVQQQQYIAQVQSQLNVQNVYVNPQQATQTIEAVPYELDIDKIRAEYAAEAQAKGMNMQQYLDYKRRDMQANSQIFNSMQNMMTENHALMLNTIGGSDDYYYVDYGNGY